MKPPVCELCGADAGEGGGLVRFADYKPLPEGMTGHPQGLEWFCAQHKAAAQALSRRATARALGALRQRFGLNGDG